MEDGEAGTGGQLAPQGLNLSGFAVEEPLWVSKQGNDSTRWGTA